MGTFKLDTSLQPLYKCIDSSLSHYRNIPIYYKNVRELHSFHFILNVVVDFKIYFIISVFLFSIQMFDSFSIFISTFQLIN